MHCVLQRVTDVTAGSLPIEMSALDVAVSRGKSKSRSQSKPTADAADGEAGTSSRTAGRKKSKASRSAVETNAGADDVVFSSNPLVEASP